MLRHRVLRAALAAACCAQLAVPALAAKHPGAAAQAASAPAPATAKKKATAKAPVKPVDINSASRAQLKTLPGIGDAEADRIVAARPYLTKTELVTKNVLPAGIYVSIKGRIIALQEGKRPRVGKSRP